MSYDFKYQIDGQIEGDFVKLKKIFSFLFFVSGRVKAILLGFMAG